MILAGGQSRRMGQDKALLPGRDGQPLLCQTVQTAWQIAPRVVVVTPWPDRYRVLLADVRSPEHPSLQPPNLQLPNLQLPNLQPPTIQLVQEPLSPKSQGPLGGFVQGWEALPSSWCLLLACDLPYLEASVLRDWWQHLAVKADSLAVASLVPGRDWRAKRLPESIEGKPPVIHKGWEPLCGFYHRRGVPGLKRYLAGGGRSFQGWLADVPVTPFYGVPKKMLFNCNTPEDWGRVQF